jgi:hypothetical protein
MRVATEKSILKQNEARIQLPEATAPPVKMKPVAVRTREAQRLYSDVLDSRKNRVEREEIPS